MSDGDRNAERFRVYVTTDIDLSKLPDLLACEWSEDGEDGYDVQKTSGTAQEICQHHKQNVLPGGEIYTSLFLIMDDGPGLLIVNLQPDHGYPDAVRHEIKGAGNVVASLSIDNHDWYDDRESSVDHKTDLVPEKWFALYNANQTALDTMNDGLQDVDKEHPFPESSGCARHFYVAAEGKDLDEIVAGHAAYAAEHHLDPSLFAVVDDNFDEGALIFNGQDSVRCKHPVAGDILPWLFIRFMTWGEVKHFVDRE